MTQINATATLHNATTVQNYVHFSMNLTIEAARELMAMVQNPILPDESQAASEVRNAIFSNLRQVLK